MSHWIRQHQANLRPGRKKATWEALDTARPRKVEPGASWGHPWIIIPALILAGLLAGRIVEGATSFLKAQNFAESTLASGITAVATSFTVQTGEGAEFPSSFSYRVVLGGTEIVTVTNRVSDTFTITRAQESTTGVAHAAGETVRLNVTASYLTEIQTAVNAIENGTVNLTAVLVGTDDTTQGAITQYGDSTTGGAKTLWYNAANEDTTYEYFVGEANNSFYQFGPNTDTDAFIFGANGVLTIAGAFNSGGTGVFGVDDTTTGYLYAMGNSTTSGGALVIKNAADEDTTYESYKFEAADNSLTFGPNTDVDAFMFDGDGDLHLSAGNLDVTIGSLGVGDTTPDEKVSIYNIATSPYIRIGYNDSYYWKFGRDGADGSKFKLINKHNAAETTPMTLSTLGYLTILDDLQVGGGDLLSTAATFNLVNAAPTTVNVGGAATTMAIGAPAGTITTSGAVVHGVDSTNRGALTLWDGAGGNTPGYIKIHSPNGTAWYVFVEDDGTLKVHNAAPTQNSDGSVVGSQT